MKLRTTGAAILAVALSTVSCQGTSTVDDNSADGSSPNASTSDAGADVLLQPDFEVPETCGNGAVDPGEQCDGNCPTTCAPAGTCEAVTLTGSPDACNVQCSVSAIESCAGGDDCCPVGCTDATDSDCPPTTNCTPGDVAGLLQTYPIEGTAHSGQIFAAPLDDGGAVVAFHDGGNVHVVEVTANGARRGTEHETQGSALYGLAAHAAGRAVLVSRGSDELALVAWAPDGTVQIDQTILGGVPHDVTENEWFGTNIRQGRLTWTGESWATYNTVQRLWDDGIAHFGDTLRFYDASGASMGGGWGWGCSHSMEVRISHNGTRVGPVCLSDCFPEKGVHFSHREQQLYTDPAANCSGGYTTQLGASIPMADGFWVLFAANDNRGSQDVALVKITNAGAMDGALNWLTADDVADASPNAAAYGDGQLLVGWSAGGSDTYALVDATTGTAIGSPQAASAGELTSASDFFTFASGQVGWAFASGGNVNLALVSTCP